MSAANEKNGGLLKEEQLRMREVIKRQERLKQLSRELEQLNGELSRKGREIETLKV